MNTNDTNNTDSNNQRGELIHGDLTYKINSVLFSTHNELGPYVRESNMKMWQKEYLKKKALVMNNRFLSAIQVI